MATWAAQGKRLSGRLGLCYDPGEVSRGSAVCACSDRWEQLPRQAKSSAVRHVSLDPRAFRPNSLPVGSDVR